uniref:Uncharacterized protein n=1 Tax=Magnetococcus massalia (strain MO-1) TaxID=451514 RepID=A0A1S7LHD3_MAGMO|nr:Protein of unknown function [Candidatus Magnetococcus massalia]
MVTIRYGVFSRLCREDAMRFSTDTKSDSERIKEKVDKFSGDETSFLESLKEPDQVTVASNLYSLMEGMLFGKIKRMGLSVLLLLFFAGGVTYVQIIETAKEVAGKATEDNLANYFDSVEQQKNLEEMAKEVIHQKVTSLIQAEIQGRVESAEKELESKFKEKYEKVEQQVVKRTLELTEINLKEKVRKNFANIVLDQERPDSMIKSESVQQKNSRSNYFVIVKWSTDLQDFKREYENLKRKNAPYLDRLKICDPVGAEKGSIMVISPSVSYQDALKLRRRAKGNYYRKDSYIWPVSKLDHDINNCWSVREL